MPQCSTKSSKKHHKSSIKITLYVVYCTIKSFPATDHMCKRNKINICTTCMHKNAKTTQYSVFSWQLVKISNTIYKLSVKWPSTPQNCLHLLHVVLGETILFLVAAQKYLTNCASWVWLWRYMVVWAKFTPSAALDKFRTASPNVLESDVNGDRKGRLAVLHCACACYFSTRRTWSASFPLVQLRVLSQC